MPGASVWKKVLGRVSIPIGAPLGNLGGGVTSTRNFENYLKEGSGLGAFLSMAALLGNLEGDSFAGDPVGYKRKALGTGISLHGGSVGQPGVGLSTGDFERWLKGVLEVEHLSLWQLCEGSLEGGLPCLGP